MKVEKAVIPESEFRTRFRLVTEAGSAEMMPVLNTPTTQHIVKDAVKSGIGDSLIVTSYGKRAIERHFGNSTETKQGGKEEDEGEALVQECVH